MKHAHKTQKSFLKRAALLPSRAYDARFLLVVVVHTDTQKRSPRAALFYINGWVRVRREEDDDAQRESCLFFFFDGGWTTIENRKRELFTTQKAILTKTQKTIFFARVFQLGFEQRERERAERERGKNRKKCTHSHQQFTHSHAHLL